MVLTMTVISGKSDSVELTDLPPPGPEDGMLVAGVAVGICGTDREILHDGIGEPPDNQTRLVIGHESLGRVLSAPEGSGFTEGDLVVGIVRRPDGCGPCQRGEWDLCRTGNYVERGIRKAHGYGAAQWRIEPEYAVRVDPLLGELGVLMEPASVVAKAWEQIDRIRDRAESCREGMTALITGAGPIGLLAALLAQQRGYQVHVLDHRRGGLKQQLVEALGGTYHTGAPHELDLRPDVVVEATGVGDLVFDLLEATGPNAVVCLTGIMDTDRKLTVTPDHINRNLVMGNTVVFGTVNAARRHYEQANEALVAADRQWLESLITRRVPLPDWTLALDKQPNDVKVIVDLTAS